MKKNLIAFALIVVGFFALYALTAQRGLGWGDSGEFQYRILTLSAEGVSGGCESFATAHPLYIVLAKALCRTPFHVTLLSSAFGALAVGGFFLSSRQVLLSVVFGLSHMLWFLSCLAEVQTMNLAFTAFETFCVLRFLDSRRGGWMVAALFLAGVHLNCHNFALLALPVYGFLLLRAGLRVLLSAALAWVLGAGLWLGAFFVRGPADVLVGSYGSQVAGFLPSNLTVTVFNFVLAAMSFAVPAAIAWWNRHAPQESRSAAFRGTVLALFAVNAIFFIRYFVPDQATFLLPTLFFAFLLVSGSGLRRDRAIALAAMQLLLPLMAYEVFRQLPQPEGRTPHPHRDDAKYFALPWKFNDDSADRCAADVGGTWNGYPNVGKGAK